MKREIKFRGKRNNGKWAYGSLVYSENIEPAIYFEVGKGAVRSFDWCYVDPDTIGQFTGLYDKNGKEIYEGDIIREIDSARAFEVVYEAPEFCMADNVFGYRFLNHPEIFELIGNIHDNKDLL